MATLNPRRIETAALQQPGAPAQPPQGPAPVTPFAATTTSAGGVQAPMSAPLAGQQPTSVVGAQDQRTYMPTGDEAQIGLDYLGQVLQSDNALMRNARTSGLEQAAQRGLMNSSIAAGASQRAALETAMPLVGMAQNTLDQREGRKWQSQEADLQRQQQITMENLAEERARAQREWTATQNQLDRDQQLTMAEVQDWLANEAFMRDFNAQLATMPINSASNLMNYIAQQAIENPEIYTPDIISGMSEFFTTNFVDVLSRYFPDYFQNQGGE